MLEAMKMQNSLLSTKTSKVSACSLFILLLLLPFFSLLGIYYRLILEIALFYKYLNIAVRFIDYFC